MRSQGQGSGHLGCNVKAEVLNRYPAHCDLRIATSQSLKSVNMGRGTLTNKG